MKRILLILSTIIVASHSLIAQNCPANPTYDNRNGTIELSDNRSLVIHSGNSNKISIQKVFAASASICVINGSTLTLSFKSVTASAGGTIFVDSTSKLVFEGNEFTNVPLTVINKGTITQKANITFSDGASVTNAGTYTASGNITFNAGSETITNSGTFAADGSVLFNSGTVSLFNTADGVFSMDKDVTLANVILTNKGSFTFNGNVVLQGATINNDNQLTIDNKTFTVNTASVVNKGVFVVGGVTVFNGNATLTNKCTFKVNNTFTNNASAVTNTGSLLLNLSSSKGDFVNQGSFVNGAQGFVQGYNFTNNSSITGAGNFYFGGNTVNNGSTFAGTGGNQINFYDATNSSSSKTFDVEAVHPVNTTKKLILPNTETAFASCANVTVPLITQQPATQFFCTANTKSATFSVAATNANEATYQWYKNNAAISGATGSSYNVSNLTLADTVNTFSVAITNEFGTTTSQSAGVKYMITTHPVSVTVALGAAASFTVKALDVKNYQWQKATSNIGGTNAATYTKALVAVSDSGSYRAVVETTSGMTCYSNYATLSISGLPSIAIQPVTKVLCSASDKSATFSVTAASLSPVTYQWYKKGSAIAGATAATYTATNLTLADTANAFKVVVTNAFSSVTSNNVYVKYVILTQPSPATQLLATGNAISFHLTTTNATSVTWFKNGASLTGSGFFNYSIPVVNAADSGSYTALVTYNGVACSSTAAVLKTSTVLYLQKDGKFNDTKSWGVNVDGTGSMPVNFLRTEHTFVVANRATAKTGGTLTIAGTLDLANANVTIEDGRSLTVGRIIRSQPGGVLSATLRDSLFIQGNAGGASDLYFDKVYNTLQRLTINGSEVRLRTRLNIANNNGDKPNNNGILTVNGGTFFTSDSLTLKSDKYGTGSIGKSLGTIVGKITVEKYINNKRSWRLMGAPVQAADAQTINAAYQEGAKSSTDNPSPGYGTHITYGATANGFDQNPQKSFSMKVLNAAGQWVGVPATNKTKVTDYPAYMLFIRGNRSYPITATTSKTPASATVLRVTGSAVQGTQPAKTVAAQGTTLVVNPYACPVNFKQIKAAGTNLKARLRMWDPSLAGTNGTGGWVTVDGTGGTWRATPPSDLTTIIQAGQGFFAESADGVNPGSLLVSEDSKDLTGKTTSGDREGELDYSDTSLEINLRILDTATAGYAITDGVLYHFGAANNDAIDGNDALKISNFSENFSIVEHNSLLTISSRTLPVAGDTLKLSLTGVKQTSYQLEFVPAGLAGKAFLLYDKYLDAYTALSATDTTRVTFSISAAAASKVASRFSLVLQPQAPPRVVLPVSITKVNAYAREKVAVVEWQVAGEKNIARYEVETSVNGVSFATAGSVSATGAAGYTFTHSTPAEGINYYRVKSVEADGSYRYTGVVTANIASSATAASSVSVYPNPLSGTRFTLTMSGMAAGSYRVAIRSGEGKLVYATELMHTGGTQSQTVTLPRSLAAGMYYLTATAAADGAQTTTKIAATN